MQIFLWSQFWPSSKNRFQITCLVQARTRDGLSSLVITHRKHAWEKVSFRRERSAESCFGGRYQSLFTAHFPQGKEIRLWKNPERCCHVSMKFEGSEWLVPNSPRRRASRKGCGESKPTTSHWYLNKPLCFPGSHVEIMERTRNCITLEGTPGRTRYPQLSLETIV